MSEDAYLKQIEKLQWLLSHLRAKISTTWISIDAKCLKQMNCGSECWQNRMDIRNEMTRLVDDMNRTIDERLND